MSRIPLIDIGPFLAGSPPEKDAVAGAVDRACRDAGFVLITGHRVPPALWANIEEAMTAFFSLPAEKKALWTYTPENPRGYRGPTVTTLSKSRGAEGPPDILERYTIGPFDLPDDEYHSARRGTVFHDNRWPEAVPAVETAAKAYYREMERLAADLMRLFARALGLTEQYFEPYFDKHTSILVTNYYPPQLEAPLPGQLRAGAHTDYGSLTILTPSKSPAGLQVLNRQGAWEDVPHVPGGLVINLGDFMAMWTNDRWVSTMHRVVNPEGAAAKDARMSVVFFQQPNDDALISCIPTCAGPDNPPKYEPVYSWSYMSAKIRKTWNGYGQTAGQQAARR